jgi:hypothetical protein
MGARYRDLKPFVRIWKGDRNIAWQKLLCICDVVRTARLTINNLRKKNNLDQSGHFFDKICFFHSWATLHGSHLTNIDDVILVFPRVHIKAALMSF